ncbi:MAG: stage IV sporulation protein A [Clostridia bacterium]|nr:stage IV sporulation protein A [Clostridia bacterium]
MGGFFMEKFDVYKDIASRTGGDIYIGVVGPVRTGKSSFISKFIDYMVVPNIINKNKRQITVDEMPLSGTGKTITTTEPKFVPSEAVKISLKNKTSAKVRLIDCVGYMVEGAFGDKEEDKERLVKTPWQDELMPFERAAEIGTEKVICDHSTIGVLITTDGSICDISRENYIKAEEKVVKKLKESGKPFVILLNCKEPYTKENIALSDSLTDKYGVKVLPINVIEASAEEIGKVLECVLMEFPLKTIDIKLPSWMQVLPCDNEVISSIIDAVRNSSTVVEKMKHYDVIESALSEVEGIKRIEKVNVLAGEGKAEYEIQPKTELFYKMISDLSSEEIVDEFALMNYIKELNVAKENYKKLKEGLFEVDENGYGIVVPEECDMSLSDPEVVKHGNRFGVKIKANTSCMHLIKINLDAEVSPISGTEKQCKDFADFIKTEYAQNPDKVWKTDVFGKPLSSLVSDEIINKINSMKDNTKTKMRKTVTKIVNDGKGKVICILL